MFARPYDGPFFGFEPLEQFGNIGLRKGPALVDVGDDDEAGLREVRSKAKLVAAERGFEWPGGVPEPSGRLQVVGGAGVQQPGDVLMAENEIVGSGLGIDPRGGGFDLGDRLGGPERDAGNKGSGEGGRKKGEKKKGGDNGGCEADSDAGPAQAGSGFTEQAKELL